MKKGSGLRTALVAFVILGILGGGGWWLWKTYAKDARPLPGSLYTVARGDIVEAAAASGTIAPHVQVEVKSRASGEVMEILVQEGDAVKAGQLLIRLDQADAKRQVKEARTAERRIQAQIAESRASLRVAELEHSNAKTTQEINTKGAGMGLISNDAARSAKHAAAVAGANVNLRKAQLTASLTELETASLAVEDAELRLSETQIVAPVNGTVLSIAVEKGTIVSSALTNVSGGTAVMTLADLTDLRVIGAIDEAQVGKVKPDQEVVIRVDAYPERTFSGKVLRVSPLGKEETSVVTFDVEILVTDKEEDLLRSGMSADVEIVTSREKDALLVPLTAIQSEGPARAVRMANGERRRIKTGATDGVNIVVLEGLEEGDEIAANAAAGRASASARPQSGNPLVPSRPARGR